MSPIKDMKNIYLLRLYEIIFHLNENILFKYFLSRLNDISCLNDILSRINMKDIFFHVLNMLP